MGMAASQARLLTLTARLADNELRSQTINNAKMRLATQSSQASEEYVKALNEAHLQFSNYAEDGSTISQNLTFNALSSYSPYNNQYGLTNASGALLVSETEAALFKNANGDLDNYLEAHGLKFETTYFNQIGALTNAYYPEEYAVIGVDELEKMYNELESYEASYAVNEYERVYSNFLVTGKKAKGLMKQPVRELLMNNTSYFGGKTNLAGISGGITQFLNKYDKYITADPKPTASDILQGITDNGSSVSVSGKELGLESQGEDDAKFYIINGSIKVWKKSDNNWTAEFLQLDDQGYPDAALTTCGDKRNDGPSDDLTKNELTCTANEDLNTFLSTLKWTIKEGGSGGADTELTVLEDFKFTSDDICTVKETVSGPDSYEQAIKDIKEYAVGELFEFLDLLSFGEDLVSKNPDLRALGISADKASEIQDAMEAFLKARTEFLDFMFEDEDSKNYIKDNMFSRKSFQYGTDSKGNPLTIELKIENLADADSLLKLIKGIREATDGWNIKISDTFDVVVKDLLVNSMIEQYGEPRYSWHDEYDVDNTGNADKKAQWYTNLFHRMESGYAVLEDGLASSKEWIKYALESGAVTMEQVDLNFNWKHLVYTNCTKITEGYDDKAVSKAEAEYQRAMNDIQAKDNIFDLELRNIDTEHTAIQTEIDIVKKVMDKNIDRTMKFNQSA